MPVNLCVTSYGVFSEMRSVRIQWAAFRALATLDSLAQAWCATIPTNAQLLHIHAVQQELPAQTQSGRTFARATTVTQVCIRCSGAEIVKNRHLMKRTIFPQHVISSADSLLAKLEASSWTAFTLCNEQLELPETLIWRCLLWLISKESKLR